MQRLRKYVTIHFAKIDIGKEGTDMAAIQAKNGPTEKLSLFLLTWPIFLEVFLLC